MVLSLGTYQSIEIPDPEGIPRFENVHSFTSIMRLQGQLILRT